MKLQTSKLETLLGITALSRAQRVAVLPYNSLSRNSLRSSEREYPLAPRYRYKGTFQGQKDILRCCVRHSRRIIIQETNQERVRARADGSGLSSYDKINPKKERQLKPIMFGFFSISSSFTFSSALAQLRFSFGPAKVQLWQQHLKHPLRAIHSFPRILEAKLATVAPTKGRTIDFLRLTASPVRLLMVRATKAGSYFKAAHRGRLLHPHLTIYQPTNGKLNSFIVD
ncbi:hypothetical protein M0802_014127 [Mischocyttarus mexicanus]|nr:hypothetical protein M0802_014127 [Mischocyttarus mexicanus]